MSNSDFIVDAIAKHMKTSYNMAIGQRMAECIKLAITSDRLTPDSEGTIEARGRDMMTAQPKKTIVSNEELLQAVRRAR